MIIKVWFDGIKNDNGGYSIASGWSFKDDSDIISSTQIVSSDDVRMVKATANWVINDITGYLNKNGLSWKVIGEYIDPKKIHDLIYITEFTGLIDFSTAKNKIFPELINNFSDETVWQIMERLNVFDKADDNEIDKMIENTLALYPDKVAQYKAGKVNLISMFIGDIMKQAKGKVKPQELTELLKKKLQ